MKSIFREIKCYALYELTLGWKTLEEILELMRTYRVFEKNVDIKNIDRKIYVVFADCLGDLMDYESSDAFFALTIPNFVFVDPYSCTNQWVLMSHELIHYLQHSLYLFSQDNHYYDWTEIMARDLQYKVREILCNTKRESIVFTPISEKPDEIEEKIKFNTRIHDYSEIFTPEFIQGFENTLQHFFRTPSEIR